MATSVTLVEQTWCPGSTAAGDVIDLPTGADPIERVTKAWLRSLTEGTPNTYSVSTPTPTKESDTQISLDTGTDAGDELKLQYLPRGGRGQVP